MEACKISVVTLAHWSFYDIYLYLTIKLGTIENV